MTKRRIGLLLVALLVVAGASAFFVIAGLNREARDVDNGVVEFKKGNYAVAVHVLAPYAERGNHAAQLNMGIAYAFGLGVARDRARARRLIKAAVPDRDAAMFVWIARSLEAGDKVEKDPSEAVAWYRVAAAEGNAEAQSWLDKSRQPDNSPLKE
jgi:TPR repeat protein